MTTQTTRIEYGETDSFRKDLKRLLKKYRTLEEDLKTVKRSAIELYHLNKIDSRSIFPIPGFCTKEIQICKIKKFTCKALKGKGAQSGIRIIYAFHTTISKVVFIEMYFKADQENENTLRINEYLKTNNL
ncbi:MAG: hypothetical protein HYU97_08475 [Deltaproteobacteria bacterium]|nr:hypothetical protein [Deltaproteobacteria bacterium]